MLMNLVGNFYAVVRRVFFLIAFFPLIFFLQSCDEPKQEAQVEEVEEDEDDVVSYVPIKADEIAKVSLSDIKERGYITAIMDNSSTGLFIYRGRPMGYEYELLSRYAETLGVELRFEITPDMEKAFEMLNNGEGDIMAFNLTVTKERKKRIAFTDYHNIVRQVLVQRKPDNWRKMKVHHIERNLVRTPIELAGKEIIVRKSSAYVSRLNNLEEEIGEDIHIIEAEPELETESIIHMVASGEINYTVADEDIAIVNSRYHPNVDIKTPVSLPQQIAWGVRKNSDSLKLSLNKWIYEMKRTSDYYTIYNKYFRSSKQIRKRQKSNLFFATKEQISPYDDLLKEAAAKIGWNWRLLAAQISQESQFDPKAKSWAGAQGLMQLMPRNAKEYGVKNIRDPRQNVMAGVKHIQWLQNVWKDAVPDSVERQKFILASYNVGHGHVQDAIRLAKKYGMDTVTWDGQVEKAVLMKSQAKYYKDKVVKYGYCRGREPVTYVKNILKLYQQYQHLIEA